MDVFDAMKKVLTQDVPEAQLRHPDLVRQIAVFQEDWREFIEMRDGSPVGTTAQASTKSYRPA
jgi:hypothetical protein